MGNAYYAAEVEAFLNAGTDAILGGIAANCGFAIEPTQRDAWVTQVEVLQPALAGLAGTVFLEFNVPRIGSRIDAVLVSGPVVFVIEFKIGAEEFRRADLNQVWDYALDLKNFHQASHHASIVPILVATHASYSDQQLPAPHADGVFPPVRCNGEGLCHLVRMVQVQVAGGDLDPQVWGRSPYQPTPTIIEAAQALFARHSVEAIARHDAGARNLGITSKRIEDLVGEAQRCQQKIVVFVTGVPGAGKTLVGLNVATKKREAQATHAVFLSGNGPLVAVLHEALTRDEVARLRQKGDKTRKGEVAQKVKAFIQNVHHFRDSGLRDVGAPSDRVVIFDEAQRAWDREMTADFMLRKKKQKGFTQSEPEFLISYMDRHEDWAVVICLVGGGQEINRGEAGISAWIEAVHAGFPQWHIYLSPNLTDSEYAAGQALQMLAGRTRVITDESLHLAVSMRSFRAGNVSSFVKAVLDGERAKARDLLMQMSARYPITLTRDLEAAKLWVRTHTRGSERFGMVASSGAQRLKPHAIDIRVEINPIHWFLSDAEDTRSSFYLEDAATEFQVQGLELDWVCMTWDADLRFAQGDWNYHAFVGSKWTSMKKADRRQYLRNAYRVLLTRARQGMVIFVPKGDTADPTRAPAYYDSTFDYLAGIGIPVLGG